MADPPVIGEIDEGRLPAILREFFSHRTSGILDLQKGRHVRRISFIGGEVRSARSNRIEQRVGQYLMRAKAIDRVQLMQALSSQDGKLPLGRRLVTMGYLDEESLSRHLQGLVREIVFECCGWQQGEFRLFVGRPALPEEVVIQVQTADLVFHGFKNFASEALAREVIGNLGAMLDPCPDMTRFFKCIRLEPGDAFILARINGTQTTDDLLRSMPGDGRQNLIAIAALVACGLVQVRGQDKRAALVDFFDKIPYLDPPPGPAAEHEDEEPMRPPQRPATRPPQRPATRPGQREARPSQSAQPAPATDANGPPERAVAVGAAVSGQPAAAARPAVPEVGLTPQDVEFFRRTVIAKYELLKAQTNHYAFLGVPIRATLKEVRSAYFSLLEMTAPELATRDRFRDLKEKMAAVRQRVEEVYGVLCDSGKRRHYNRSRGFPTKW